jgi:hypothetical protein
VEIIAMVSRSIGGEGMTALSVKNLSKFNLKKSISKLTHQAARLPAH